MIRFEQVRLFGSGETSLQGYFATGSRAMAFLTSDSSAGRELTKAYLGMERPTSGKLSVSGVTMSRLTA